MKRFYQTPQAAVAWMDAIDILTVSKKEDGDADIQFELVI